jgi:hypothetical protein
MRRRDLITLLGCAVAGQSRCAHSSCAAGDQISQQRSVGVRVHRPVSAFNKGPKEDGHRGDSHGEA